jgi:hypothetical protein
MTSDLLMKIAFSGLFGFLTLLTIALQFIIWGTK